MKKEHLIHLYNRAGFGLTPTSLKKLANKTTKEVVHDLLNDFNNYNPLWVDKENLNNIRIQYGDNPTPEQKKEINKEKRELVKQLNLVWFKNLFQTQTPLLDKMILFWTNHFVAADNAEIELIEQYHDVIKKNALGNFRNFVTEISKNPLMIKYLNNRQNKKDHPNENYARELMELFTLGVGNYSEKDIQESARAFTGWFYKEKEFHFSKAQHDFDEKIFMGKKGTFDGTDIINIILEQEQCALFISEKIYKYFVNPTPNKQNIKQMAKVFRNKYDIKELMEYMLTSDWFYQTENIGVKIKSPVELLVGIYNIFPFQLNKKNIFLNLQHNLGQKLLYPPNVAGWPGDKFWIDTNTITLRLKLASTIANQSTIEIYNEVAFEDEYELIAKKQKRKDKTFQTVVDWSTFQLNIGNTNNQDLTPILLGSKLRNETIKFINTEIINEKSKEYCIEIMSLPEYQLC